MGGCDRFFPDIPTHADYHRMEEEARQDRADYELLCSRVRPWLLHELPPAFVKDGGRLIRHDDIVVRWPDIGADIHCKAADNGGWDITVHHKNTEWWRSVFQWFEGV